MFRLKIKRLIGLVALLVVAGFASISVAQVAAGSFQPDLPPGVCDSVQAPAGHSVSYHTYARGAQIYRWDGNSWLFVAPRADLFTIAGFRPKVMGIHHGGPIWESADGSKVLGTRVASCTPNSTAIPWLLLKGASTGSPGAFNRVTFIQRVNTIGGVAPATPGAFLDEMREVPYTTEYYFYRAEN